MEMDDAEGEEDDEDDEGHPRYQQIDIDGQGEQQIMGEEGMEEDDDQMDPEAIQTIVYSVGKENGYKENLREWFKAIYEIIFGDQDGPRMGFFISFFGIKETIELINKCIK